MKYYIGPWQWRTENDESYWAPPAGFAGIDLRPLPMQAVAGGTPGLGLFCGEGNPGRDCDLLGTGSWRDIKSTSKMRDMLPGRPQGDDLLGLVLSLFTDRADPDGIDGVKPLMPTVERRMALHFGGQSHFERFNWGDKYTAKVRDVIQRDFRQTMEAAQRGELKDDQQHLRVLDATCEKYGVDDWQEFVPNDLKKDVPGRVKHETTYTDDFNRADSTGLGSPWANMLSVGFDVSSNQARGSGSAGSATRARYGSDLSSADHYAQNQIIYGLGFHSFGSLVRCSTSADTCYAFLIRATQDRNIYKVVAGVSTSLSSDAVTTTYPATFKLSVNGSELKAYNDGVEITGIATTDSSISSGLQGGMQGRASTLLDNRSVHDDFETADLAASGILFTQLERGTRGILRGMYTRWG